MWRIRHSDAEAFFRHLRSESLRKIRSSKVEAIFRPLRRKILREIFSSDAEAIVTYPEFAEEGEISPKDFPQNFNEENFVENSPF